MAKGVGVKIYWYKMTGPEKKELKIKRIFKTEMDRNGPDLGQCTALSISSFNMLNTSFQSNENG